MPCMDAYDKIDNVDRSSPASVQQLRSSLGQFKFVPPTSSSLRRSTRLAIVKKEEDEETDHILTLVQSPSNSGTSRKRTSSAAQAGEAKSSHTKKARTRSSSPVKPKKEYALPDKYAHLQCLTDRLKEELSVIFVGINPGVESAKKGAHFAHPSNHFWKCLHSAGFTNRRIPPTEEYILPGEFNIGLTDLVDRPSAEAAELSDTEKRAAVPVLLAKFGRYRPRFVCFVGKVIWDFVEPVLKKNAVSLPTTILPNSEAISAEGHKLPQDPVSSKVSSLKGSEKSGKAEGDKGRAKGKKRTGIPFPYHLPLPYKMVHDTSSSNVQETLFFVVPSTSGLVAQYQLADKVRFFTALKACVDEEKLGKLDKSCMVPVSIPGS